MNAHTPQEYAQQRADETRQRYATYSYPLESECILTYVALYCRWNVKTYKDLGATIVVIFKPEVRA